MSDFITNGELRIEAERLCDENEELQAENAKLRDLCKKFANYVSADRCEGCVLKRRCNDGDVDECWQLADIRKTAHEVGIEVD